MVSMKDEVKCGWNLNGVFLVKLGFWVELDFLEWLLICDECIIGYGISLMLDLCLLIEVLVVLLCKGKRNF